MGSFPSKLVRAKAAMNSNLQRLANVPDHETRDDNPQGGITQDRADPLVEEKKEDEDEEQEDKQEEESEEQEDEQEEDEEQEEEQEDEDEDEEDENSKEEEGVNEENEENNTNEDNEDEDEEEEEYETWGGKKVKIEYSGRDLKALRGSMNVEYPEKTQIVRIFTSSTFTDTSVERNTLMETIYPKLKIFCQKKGFEFQVVDMRWGVRDEATDDHLTTELCMRELYACQKLSTGPSFITFLGQKYGYRPFPPKISESEFSELTGAMSGQDVSTLQTWFQLDTNAVPKEYVLQPITCVLPNYRNYSNQDLRKAASTEWWACFERMQMALRKAALKVLDKKNQQKYLMSVTEDEIRRGIITAEAPEKHCFWFKRSISDLNNNVDEQKAGSFIDKVWGKDGVDEEAQQLLTCLRENDLPKILPERNVKHYDVKWSKNGIDPSAEKAHEKYVKTLCDDFYSTLTKMINNGIEEKQSKESNDEPILDEVCQQAIFCQKKCKSFHGRETFLKDIQQGIENGATTLVLHGESGCGKTSVMARVASSVAEWLGDKKTTVVVRFIGTTADSFAIRDLLKSICSQLCKATGHKTEIPEDLKSLKDHLSTCLELAAEKHPVVLVLDSLDQLSPDDGGLQLEWLPRTLPGDVHVILSTLPEEKYTCLPKLKTQFPAECFKAVPKMSKDEANGILDKWLDAAKRTLTSQQRQVIIDRFNECPLPLFLKLAFDEAVRWKSYTPEAEICLASSIREIIHSLFDRLEKLHGKMLISRSLAYISASKNGLTETELEDLLSLDDDVLNDVYQYWTPPVRRLPPLLWLRVRSDLGDYLVERGADGVRVSFWYHRQFIEVSRERYLDQQLSPSIHSNIAEYFLGTWCSGKKKPFVNKKGEHLEMDRLVAQQPVMYDDNEENPVYNKRKLAELPYHLVKSNQVRVLKDTALCNFHFLLAKVRALSHSLVMDDLRMAVSEFPHDEELQLMYDTLGLCTNALKLEPRQLASQLIGRLFNMYNDLTATAQTHPSIAKLFEQLNQSSVSFFLPNMKCLTSSGGPLLHAIAEHDENSMVDSMCLAHDNSSFVTTVRGNEGLEIRVFNLKAGMLQRKVILTEPVPDVYFIWHSILSRQDKTKLIMVGGRNILVFDLSTGHVIQTIEALSEDLQFMQGAEGPPIALGNQYLAALTDKGLKIWDVASGSLKHDISIKKMDASASLGTLDANDTHVVYCRKGTNDVHVVDIVTGKMVHTIKSAVTTKGASVKFVNVTEQGKIVVMADNSTELKIYDAMSGKLDKDVAGFSVNQSVKGLIISDDGSKLICQDKYDLVIWDMSTWKNTKVLTDMAHIHSTNICTNDGRIVIHANVQDRIVRVYDASKDEVKEGSAGPSQWVVNQINALCPSVDGRHFITMGTVNSTTQISVWDAKQGKTQRVFNNNMFYPTVLRMITPTIGVGYIYNEKLNHYVVLDFDQGKMVCQLQGKACNRMHMMQALDGNRMVSFSRGRRNLKIWSLETGKVVDQIKFGQKHRFEAFILSDDKQTIVIAQAGTYTSETLKDDTVPFIVYNFVSKKHHFIREQGVQQKMEVNSGSGVNACLSHTGQYMINVVGYMDVVLWDVQKARKMHSLSTDPPAGAVYSVAMAEKKKLALTSYTGAEHGVHMWDILTGKCVRKIVTTCIGNDLAISSDERLVFWKDMQNSSFYVNEVDTCRNLATFTSDQPVMPTAFSVVGDRVAMATMGSVTPFVFSIREAQNGGKSEKIDKSVFEQSGNNPDKFDYSPHATPPDSRDVDDDKDDDKGQAC